MNLYNCDECKRLQGEHSAAISNRLILKAKQINRVLIAHTENHNKALCRHTGGVRWKDDWSGIETLSADYVEDVDHDGTCAIYRCQKCGETFHVELPD